VTIEIRTFLFCMKKIRPTLQKLLVPLEEVILRSKVRLGMQHVPVQHSDTDERKCEERFSDRQLLYDRKLLVIWCRSKIEQVLPELNLVHVDPIFTRIQLINAIG